MIQKQSLINKIVDTMMAAEYRRLKANVDQIIDKNCVTAKTPITAFLYSGNFYCKSAYSRCLYDKNCVHSLHSELEKEMAEHIEDEKQVKLDESLFRQLIHVLIKNGESIQDFRNMLPDFIVSIVPALAKYERTVPFVDCQSDLAIIQTNKLIRSMQVYSAGRLFY